MRQVLVRYRPRPEEAEENERLIRNVFAELRTKAPDDLRYLVLRLADGSFVHFKSDTADGPDPIHALEAFQAFIKGVRERSIEPPVPADATIIGNYRMLEA